MRRSLRPLFFRPFGFINELLALKDVPSVSHCRTSGRSSKRCFWSPVPHMESLFAAILCSPFSKLQCCDSQSLEAGASLSHGASVTISAGAWLH